MTQISLNFFSEIGVMKQKSFGIVKTLLVGGVGGAAAGVGLATAGSAVMASIAAGTMTTTTMTTLVGSFFGPLDCSRIGCWGFNKRNLIGYKVNNKNN